MESSRKTLYDRFYGIMTVCLDKKSQKQALHWRASNNYKAAYYVQLYRM